MNSISEINIYYYDPFSITADNPQGKLLVQTISGEHVVNDAEGSYYLDVDLPSPQYVIGNYSDEWTVQYEVNAPEAIIKKNFEIFQSLWYSSEIPIVYDFSFFFQPNRLAQGSKKWIIIEIRPNVAKASDLEQYYTNLAISSELKISIAQKCSPCLPQEQDLRTIVDEETVEQREKVFGYYWLDTSEMDGGMYDVWFTLDFGGNTYVSDRQQLHISC